MTTVIATRPTPIDAEIKFAYIPPGNQPVGSTLVAVKGFYMGVYPVTQAQFRAVLGYNPAPSSTAGTARRR